MNAEDYGAFAARLVGSGLITDPWIDGQPRFRAEPLILTPDEQAELAQAAEEVAQIHDELVRIVAADNGLLESYFGLSPFQQAMFLAAAPLWHGLARADCFFTAQGVRICELNSDTPSGEAEAVLLNALAAERHPECVDPNASFGALWVGMIEACAAACSGQTGALAVGIVYPTEMPEDLSMVRLFTGWLEGVGHRVALGSPFNLVPAEDGRAALMGLPCDVIVRHYKTDWWGERSSPWDTEPDPPDSEPLSEPLATLLAAALAGRTAVINPFGAVLTQNKRALAFLWEEQRRFSAEAQAAIRRWIPYTARLEAMDPATIAAERERWVLKSDYGCEGVEVIVGAEVDQDTWDDCLREVRPTRWVVQERFTSLRNEAGEEANVGVFVVAGEAAAWFTRLQSGTTDTHAMCVPTLVQRMTS